MKKVGLIGGIGPASTLDYYMGIINGYMQKTKDKNYPSRIDYAPASDIVLNEDEALSRAWSYMIRFGIMPSKCLRSFALITAFGSSMSSAS